MYQLRVSIPGLNLQNCACLSNTHWRGIFATQSHFHSDFMKACYLWLHVSLLANYGATFLETQTQIMLIIELLWNLRNIKLSRHHKEKSVVIPALKVLVCSFRPGMCVCVCTCFYAVANQFSWSHTQVVRGVGGCEVKIPISSQLIPRIRIARRWNAQRQNFIAILATMPNCRYVWVVVCDAGTKAPRFVATLKQRHLARAGRYSFWPTLPANR